MKTAVVLLALVTLSFSAPQPKKIFHEHFEDFISIIEAESGEQLYKLTEQYIGFDEFLVSLTYAGSKDFRDLIYEMESLPEFKAVVDFLENDNIDIMFFVERLNEMIEGIPLERRNSGRIEASGNDFNSYIKDVISLFPKEKLLALFEQKLDDDEQFKVTMDNLLGDEWSQTFEALWQSEVFQVEVQTLADHGIDVHILLQEIIAIFGLN